MIAGTIQMEGLSMHFRVGATEEEGVEVRVQDGLTGMERAVKCSVRAFAASLAIALDWDGFDGTEICAALYEYAEEIDFPKTPEAPNALRWIP